MIKIVAGGLLIGDTMVTENDVGQQITRRVYDVTIQVDGPNHGKLLVEFAGYAGELFDCDDEVFIIPSAEHVNID